MAVTIRQTEGAPDAYPEAPPVAGIEVVVVWQRIEAYVAHRWSERDVEWIVEGAGEWCPPLAGATIATVSVWRNDRWEEADHLPSPLGGYRLHGDGPYRFTGTVGSGEPPAAVLEAFRRLAVYMAAKPGKPGATVESVSAGSISLNHRRSASWIAEAMQNSGAADLLRPYRRA